METPAPVDISKLKAILGNAKKVMKAADEKFPEKKTTQSISEGFAGYSQPSTPVYDERDEREPDYGVDYSDYTTTAPVQQRDYTSEDVMNSKLPPIVKEAMLKNPIPKLTTLPSKFSIEDLGDLVDKPKQKPAPRRQINETTSQDWGRGTITISVDELNEMIDKRVNEVVAKMFVKTLTEQTIKKTLNTLISEGRLNTKKK